MRRLISFVLTIFSLLVIGSGALAFYVWASFTEPGALAKETILVVPKGAGVGAIAALLEREGVIDQPLVFQIGVRLWGRDRSLRAGEYAFPVGVSPRAAMRILIEGKSIQHQVTIAEGLTVAEIYAVLEETTLLEGDPPPAPPEGSLLPETYSYLRGENRATLVERMRRAMEMTLEKSWADRDPNTVLESKEQALILASIVEKETGISAERAHVAAVFHNRLKKGMRLQSDPTVIFALTLGKERLGRALSREDLEIDNPYNTYFTAGLPPGPIANPGWAAILATLNPLPSEDLYFVADGTGGHVFAETLDEHKKNVAKWREIQAQQSGD